MEESESTNLLYQGPEWDFGRVSRTYEAIEEIAFGEIGLDIYPNQIEVITAEQMLDAYSSIGLPLMYQHWSFGKHFARDEMLYRKGLRGLAYEIVINSSPCISYIMEENSMTMQTLVMAHAAFGHNHFFKNNYLFQQWTDAEGILDYMEFAKSYLASCEEKHGHAAVERILDAAHSLMNHGVHRYPKPRKPDLREEQRRSLERRTYEEQTYNDLWRTVPKRRKRRSTVDDTAQRRTKLGLPEENLLYFFEKVAPKLEPWQREVIRIVRNVAQYFYPQRQTKVMNEGCATFCHYYIMNRLYDRRQIDNGAMLEFLDNHSAVIFQPDFDDRRYSGLNPYTLGFSMMQDIQRICEAPSNEDREWFPDIAGNGDPMGTLREAWANFRDESFILQFLSPHLIRKMKLFMVDDDEDEPEYLVEKVHNERGYAEIRRALARRYDIAYQQPDIQVVDVDLEGDRRLVLQHNVTNDILLEEEDAEAVLKHVAYLWGYPVVLNEVDPATDTVIRDYTL